MDASFPTVGASASYFYSQGCTASPQLHHVSGVAPRLKSAMPQQAFQSSTCRPAFDVVFSFSSIVYALLLSDFAQSLNSNSFSTDKATFPYSIFSEDNDIPSDEHSVSALPERFVRSIFLVATSTMPRSEVSTYAPLPFHTIRALALTSTIIVSAILGYFCFQLKNDGFKLPWTLLVVC